MTRQLELADFATVTRRCRRCGEAFAAPARQVGRGPIYCGEACRRTAAAEQRQAWQEQHRDQTNDVRGAVACLHCGAAFTPPRHAAGRLARLCSEACRRARKLEGKRRRARSTFTAHHQGGQNDEV